MKDKSVLVVLRLLYMSFAIEDQAAFKDHPIYEGNRLAFGWKMLRLKFAQ